MKSGLEIKDRKWRLRTYTSCFIGSPIFSDLRFTILGEEAVNWLVLNGFASTREEAVLCGRDLMSLGLIKHVTEDKDFRDGFFFYRFVVSSEFMAYRQSG